MNFVNIAQSEAVKGPIRNFNEQKSATVCETRSKGIKWRYKPSI